MNDFKCPNTKTSWGNSGILEIQSKICTMGLSPLFGGLKRGNVKERQNGYAVVGYHALFGMHLQCILKMNL